jgi:hypothetical protein
MAKTGASANVTGGDTHLKFANVLVVGMCSGLHYLKAQLAIEHLFRPTIIDSDRALRLTLIAPEPTVLILGLQSSPAGSHIWQQPGSAKFAQLYGEFFA